MLNPECYEFHGKNDGSFFNKYIAMGGEKRGEGTYKLRDLRDMSNKVQVLFSF